jgi:hypothetical protein
LQKRQGVPPNFKTPHVGNIENAAVLARRQVFGQDAGCKIERHFPAAELDHLPAQPDVLLV